MYQPDKFVVLKLTFDSGQVRYLLFGTWMGGYLSGDSWRLNSGIKEVDARGPFLLFRGFSGSTYKVHKDMYGLSSYTDSILHSWERDHEKGFGPKIEVLPYDTDWVNFEWEGVD